MSEDMVYVAKDDDGRVVAMSVIGPEAADTVKGWIGDGFEVDQMTQAKATVSFIKGITNE